MELIPKEGELNPEYEKMLKNYPNLMQKASSATSKSESQKLMEDYFSYLKGKEKPHSQPNSSPFSNNLNNAGDRLISTGSAANLTTSATNSSLNMDRNNSNSSKSALNAYIQNPNPSGWKDGFEMYQDPNSQGFYSEKSMGNYSASLDAYFSEGQPMKHQKTEPNGPNLVGNMGMYSSGDPKLNSASIPSSLPNTADNYSAVRPDAKNVFFQPQQRVGMNTYMSGPTTNYPQGGGFGNMGMGGAPFAQNQGLGPNYATSFHMNQPPLEEMYRQQPTFNSPYQMQNPSNDPQQNASSQLYSRQLPPQSSMGLNDMSRKPFDNSGQQYFNKPDQKFDFNTSLGMSAGNTELNSGNRYPYMGMPPGQQIVDFNEGKKNPYAGPNSKIAQAFPSSNAMQGAGQKVTEDNMGNIKPSEIAEEIDKIMQDGNLNVRMNVPNDFDSFPKGFEDSYY